MFFSQINPYFFSSSIRLTKSFVFSSSPYDFFYFSFFNYYFITKRYSRESNIIIPSFSHACLALFLLFGASGGCARISELWGRDVFIIYMVITAIYLFIISRLAFLFAFSLSFLYIHMDEGNIGQSFGK